MKNKEVVEDFVDSDKQSRTEHLFIEDNVLYSYGHHFPLGIKLKCSKLTI